jgi:hypothetical protein
MCSARADFRSVRCLRAPDALCPGAHTLTYSTMTAFGPELPYPTFPLTIFVAGL